VTWLGAIAFQLGAIDRERKMDSGKLVTLAMGLLPGYVLAVLIYGTIIRVVERSLTFKQSAMIAGTAVAILFAVLIVYYIARAPYYKSRDIDNLAGLVAYCITGIVITRLARNYGIKKLGWFGVGARVNCWLLVAAWAIIALIFGAQYLFSR
jgi:tetrahydromethanopterin S-methyltransferase subunit F